jgi:hypothetical protein
MSDRDEAASEAILDQLHQLLVEVKDHLEDADTRKGQKLLGKVELVLENWDDDAFFVDGDDSDDDEEFEDEDYDEDDEDDGEDEDEGSILDEVIADELDDHDDEPYDEDEDDDGADEED